MKLAHGLRISEETPLFSIQIPFKSPEQDEQESQQAVKML